MRDDGKQISISERKRDSWKRGKRHILTGGIILITLGVLIFLPQHGPVGFGDSWRFS